MQSVPDEFRSYLKTQGLTESSTDLYTVDARNFLSWLEGRCLPIEEIIPDDIKDWINMLANSSLSPSTQQRKLASIRKLFLFLMRTGRAKSNPAQLVRIHRVGRRAPAHRADPRILEALEQSVPYKFSERDEAMIALLSKGGLRVSEIESLRCKHITQTDDGVEIKIENGWPRIVVIRGEHGDRIHRYRLALEKSGRTDTDPFFCNHSNQPICRQAIWATLFRRSERLGIPVLNPASLRNLFIQELVNSGQTCEQIARKAGLRHTDSLRIYRSDRPASVSVTAPM